jgi:vitamin K-dependent gamma-carboxylase
MLKRLEKFLERARRSAFAPVDIASIVFFRIALGLLMAWHVWTFFTEHRLVGYFLEPRLLFKYYGFAWVQPWPGNGLYIHKIAMTVSALFIAAGLFYRASATLFLLSYLYFFLLDEARYQNHEYLICLFTFFLIFIPAHRALSLDAMARQRLRTQKLRQRGHSGCCADKWAWFIFMAGLPSLIPTGFAANPCVG